MGMTAPLVESRNTLPEYRGTGESFIFKLAPKFAKYKWVGLAAGLDAGTQAPKMFLNATSERLLIGGGGGHAIELDSALHHGRSSRCDTYNNEPMCESNSFECVSL